MKLRSPVMVPCSILPSSMSRYSLGLGVLLSLMGFDRHEREMNACLMTSLLRLYSRSMAQGDPWDLSIWWDTNSERNAVAAVMAIPRVAAVNCQKISQVESTLPFQTSPDMRQMVQIITTMVRQSEDAKASLWDHPIRIFQISRHGMKRTASQVRMKIGSNRIYNK